MDLEKAQATVAELMRKRDKAVELWKNMTAERSAISFAAIAEGDKDAKKRLDQINSDGVKINAELESIDAAIGVARERVEQAKRDEQRGEDRDRALKLRDELKVFVKLGEQMDHHLQAFAALADQAKTSTQRIHALGHGAPNWSQFETFGAMAVNAVLMFTPWKREVAQHLAPRDRRTFTQLFQGWAAGAERAVAAILDEEKSDAA